MTVLMAVAAAGCASSGARLSDSERLGAYLSSAGEPVTSFRITGSVNGWTSLGDRHLAVWTRSNQAYLLELATVCPDLRNAFSIGIMNSNQRVQARFDSVLVQDRGSITVRRAPCTIATIRPVDTDALDAAEDELKQMNMIQRESSP
jgi:hypothetical protein